MKSQFRIMAVFVAALASGTAFSANADGMSTVLGSGDGAQGAGGQVNFSGEITDAACDIVSESTNQNVDLGKWASSYFKATGTETTKTPFHIKVKDCPQSVSKVSVLFDGQKDSAESDLLAVTGGATGVGIQLIEADESTEVPLGVVSKEYPIDAGADGADGSADLTFYANYRATADKVKAGKADGVANFEMVYN
ncbi:fimbrial protein [Pseudocitrobacter cyperus]|uniref:Fimbrial protein n=1 Tax=Pseudocitrobacter cyperus TaxID=3112843 RepID=A0ABV0HLC7_9ENTR